jgi:hypothetical protein
MYNLCFVRRLCNLRYEAMGANDGIEKKTEGSRFHEGTSSKLMNFTGRKNEKGLTRLTLLLIDIQIIII